MKTYPDPEGEGGGGVAVLVSELQSPLSLSKTVRFVRNKSMEGSTHDGGPLISLSGGGLAGLPFV
jgi:hypothetical protein